MTQIIETDAAIVALRLTHAIPRMWSSSRATPDAEQDRMDVSGQIRTVLLQPLGKAAWGAKEPADRITQTDPDVLAERLTDYVSPFVHSARIVEARDQDAKDRLPHLTALLLAA